MNPLNVLLAVALFFFALLNLTGASIRLRPPNPFSFSTALFGVLATAVFIESGIRLLQTA